MDNPLLKNRKTGLHNDIQHRTSHYNRILAAKSFYKTQQISERSPNHSKQNKSQRIENQRNIENRKLINSIIAIEKRERVYTVEKASKAKSLQNQFVVKEGLKKIMEQNKILYEKIKKVNPEIGTRKEWRLHNKKRKIIKNLKTNNVGMYSDLDSQFYTIYQHLRSTRTPNRPNLKFQSTFSTQLSPKRISNRNNKFFTEPIQ